ncbi:MAG: hypothetical protein H7263_12910 [Candidatus Sericytochromatia bacterium]|nr:hypothetical protein [Candidatus Sericytochromatia bacterium]
MRIKTYKNTRGQSMVEYAIIASVVILGLVAASNGIAFMMKGQVESTAQGLSSGSYPKN